MLAVSRLLETRNAERGTRNGKQQPARGVTSELRVPSAELQSAPAVVVWNVCRHCNQRCPHCYIAAGPRPSRGALDTEGGKRLLETIARGGVRAVVLSGGEPLLREDLVLLVRHAVSMGMGVHLSTNGTLLDRAMARTLAEAGLSYAGVSIDGPREANDAYRGMPGGFDRAVEGLLAARGAGLATGLRMTLARGSAPHVEELADLARWLGLDRFYVSHLVYSGRGLGMMPGALSGTEARPVVEGLFQLAERWLDEGVPTRIVTGAGDFDGPCLVLWTRDRHGVAAARRVERVLAARGGNTAGEGVLCVDPRGRVYPDPFWRTAPLGNLARQSLAEVLAHPLARDLARREDLLTGRCGACAFKPLCRGAHRARAEAATGDRWGSDPACILSDAEIAAQANALDLLPAGSAP